MNCLFFIFSALILITAALVVFRPRPVESAMWLILNFLFTAGLFILLDSHFVATLQVLVYAGAIMVLFVFVILLLNLDPKELSLEAPLGWTTTVLLLGLGTFLLLSFSVITSEGLKPFPALISSNEFGGIELISQKLITDYVWSFEIAGVILLLAIIGVGMLAYRKKKTT